MPINAGHEYFSVEKEYLAAQTLADKIYWLEELIRVAPKHKSSENLLAGLRTRLKKFKEQQEKAGKKKKGKKGIRKEGFQFVLIGKSNVGKSSLLNKLTGASSVVAEYGFTTREPEIGTFDFQGVKAQIIDTPAIGSEAFDIGLINGADCLIVVVQDLSELNEIEQIIRRSRGKRFVVVNKTDKLNSLELRKLEARMKSKKIYGILVSAETGEGLDELREALFQITGFVRVYMKEPGKKKAEERPMVLKAGDSVKDVAEHILKGFSSKVKEIRLTGPSGKFSNQRVGLTHKIKDKDIVEFITR